MVHLTEKEWDILATMAGYFLEGIADPEELEESGCGYVRCFNTLEKEEVELLKKLANK